MVHLSAASHLNLPMSQSGSLQRYHHGKWKPNASTGGCLNYTSTIHTNPLYRIDLKPRSGKRSPKSETVLGPLMQKSRNPKAAVGFYLHKVSSSAPTPLDKKLFLNNLPSQETEYQFSREISGRFELDHECLYFIVPTTLDPYRNVKFLLRVSMEK